MEIPPPSVRTESTISNAVPTSSLDLEDTVEGTIDYRGTVARRSKSGRWRSAFFIIGIFPTEITVFGTKN